MKRIDAKMYCVEEVSMPRRVSGFDEEDMSTIPLELNSYDVICDGIGKIDHIGNRRLAITLSINCGTYMAAKSLSERKEIAASVVETVTSSYRPGGRFLKTDKNKKWVAVDRKQAIQWVYKAFQRIVAPKAQKQKWLDYYEGAKECSALSMSASTLIPVPSLSISTSLAMSVPDNEISAEEEAIDAQLADLLLKQNRIFMSLSEKGDAEETRKKPTGRKRKYKSTKRQSTKAGKIESGQ